LNFEGIHNGGLGGIRRPFLGTDRTVALGSCCAVLLQDSFKGVYVKLTFIPWSVYDIITQRIIIPAAIAGPRSFHQEFY
jgi:hypothetical protein